MRKKKILIIGIICLLIICAGVIFFVSKFKPKVYVKKDIITQDSLYSGNDYYRERINIIVSTSDLIKTSKKFDEELDKYVIWADEIETDLRENYTGPMNVIADGKIENGTTTFWYEGTVTNHEGVSMNYHKEMAFDTAFGVQEDMFK